MKVELICAENVLRFYLLNFFFWLQSQIRPWHMLALVCDRKQAFCISGKPVGHCYFNNLWPSHVFNCASQRCHILLWVFWKNSLWDCAAVLFCARAATLSDALCINCSAALLSSHFLSIAWLVCLYLSIFSPCMLWFPWATSLCSEVNCISLR